MSSKAAKVKVKAHPVVVMEAEVARKIRQHSRTSMKAEVCGVLIGSAISNNNDERTVIDGCIAGINAAQGGAHVTFTQDTWEHIYKIKDEQYPDKKIVGWYHSHPGFGVFLSEHDLFIQENFFSSPQQVAWVYDPHTDEEGCFGWVGGKTEKLTGVRFGYSQSVDVSSSAGNDYDNEDEASLDSMVKVHGRRKDQDREPAWVKWTSRAVAAFSCIALGFTAGLFFWDLSPWARSTLHRLGQEIQQQQMDLIQTCAPELQACQARVLRAPSTPPTEPGSGTTPPKSQPSPQQQTKEPAKARKDNAKQ